MKYNQILKLSFYPNLLEPPNHHHCGQTYTRFKANDQGVVSYTESFTAVYCYYCRLNRLWWESYFLTMPKLYRKKGKIAIFMVNNC